MFENAESNGKQRKFGRHCADTLLCIFVTLPATRGMCYVRAFVQTLLS